MTLTATREDYIREIARLIKKDGQARPIEIAKRLGLARSTVTERLQALHENGYITGGKYQPVTLSQKGDVVAAKLTRKHRIIETFLFEMLKRPIDEIHDEAHELEHAFAQESIEAIYALLGSPTHDPHGQPIQDDPY